MKRNLFLKTQVKKYLQMNSTILIFGGGQMEKEVFNDLKYDLTFLNIDNHDLYGVKYKTIIGSMQNSKIENEKYDYVIANASIHHSSQPHACIIEMLRIAKKGILILEGNDSLITKIACSLNISEVFEKSAIEDNKGGVDNTNIPNYIYRWTEKEIHKLINSFDPKYKYKISFNYNFDLGNVLKNSTFKRKFLFYVLSLFFSFFKKQKNMISVFINKENRVAR